jgi:hypothetical protein
MAMKWREIISGATLSAAPVSLFTAPTLTYETIQQATVYNPTGAPITFALYKVPTGLTPVAGTLICTRSVAAGQCIQANEAINHKLEPGTQLFASGLALTLNVSGVEYVPGT